MFGLHVHWQDRVVHFQWPHTNWPLEKMWPEVAPSLCPGVVLKQPAGDGQNGAMA